MKNALVFASLIIIALILAATGCTHQRPLKQGREFEQQGLYNDAYDAYYQALQTKNKPVEAKLGLQRTGRHRIESLLKDFSKAYEVSNYQEAVYHYGKATDIKDKAARFGVDLEIPPYYKEYYQESKEAYLKKQYQRSIKLLSDENFKQAAKILQEIIEIDDGYKDAKSHLRTAVFEPQYRRACKFVENKKYRSAYHLFGQIIDKTGHYKDCMELHEEAKEEATIYIGMGDITGNYHYKKEMSQLNEAIADAISKSENSFIKLVEYDDKGRVPDAILKGKLISLMYKPGIKYSDDVPGYFRKNENNYKKIKYDVYKQNRKISINASLKLVNTKNNELMISENYDISASDYIHYADYDGDDSRLVPGYWKYLLLPNREDVIKTNPEDVANLQSLLKARRKIKSKDELFNELSENIAEQMVKTIENYNPEAY